MLLSAWSRTGSRRERQISAVLQAGLCQVGLQHPPASHCEHPPPKHSTGSLGLLPGTAASTLQLQAKDTCSPLPKACQVLLPGPGPAERPYQCWERMGASCLSPALHCNYCSINTTGISDVRAQCATPGSAWPRKNCHPCPHGGCALVLAASACPGGKDVFSVPGCVQRGMDRSHRQPLILACCQTAHLGQGKGLPASALCHRDNVTSCARQAGALWPAGRTDL